MTPEQNAPQQPIDPVQATKLSRRSFLQGAGAAIALAALAGFTEPASAPGRGLSVEEEKPFNIDAELQKKIESAIEGGISFLNARYDPEVGLLQESPQAEPTNFWIDTPTTIACKALEANGEEDLSVKLENRVKELEEKYNTTFYHGVVEALEGSQIQWPPRTTRSIKNTQPIEEFGEKKVLSEERNLLPILNWFQYADLTLWGALAAYNDGNTALALERYQHALSMFDGNGLADIVHKESKEGFYNTYKPGLALHVGRVLGVQPDETTSKILNIILSMQDTVDPNTGGFTSYYIAKKTSEGANLEPQGDANVETTALSLLALSHFKESKS